MNSHEIIKNVKRIIGNFSKENFLYDLLLAYVIFKTSITRLKSGDFNLLNIYMTNTMTVKINKDNGLQARWIRAPVHNL
jgi:hypothetical protein